MHCRARRIQSERSISAERISTSASLKSEGLPLGLEIFPSAALHPSCRRDRSFPIAPNSYLLVNVARKTSLANYWFGTKATSSTLFTFTMFVTVLVAMSYS
jgi:hypothetical protein